jgi:hypothetical protein
MAFGRDIQYTVAVAISDFAGDKAFPIWRVPAEVTKIEILEAWVCVDTTKAAGTVNGMDVALFDGGSDASGTALLTNRLGGTGVGGTFPVWTANTPQSWTISEGTLDAGDYVVLDYDETGTDAPLNMLVSFVYVSGIGA